MQVKKLYPVMIVAVLYFLFMAVLCHSEPIDSLQKQINVKQHELYSGSAFGYQISQLAPEAIPGFLSFLLRTHLRDTLQVYHMAATVKQIAHMKRQQSQILVKRSFIPVPVAIQYQKKQTSTVAMIDSWYEKQGNDDEPVILHEKLHIDWDHN
jgi:hypothetical protein